MRNGSRSTGGFEICIDGLSFWLMRIARGIGRGTSVQALRERRTCQERADAQQAALLVCRPHDPGLAPFHFRRHWLARVMTEPDRHLQLIAEHSRMGWQK